MTSTAEAPAVHASETDEDTYRLLWPGLVRLARLLVGSQAAAEDLAQDAFLGLLRAPAVQHPEAYLRRSIVNLAINSSRRQQRERQHLATLPEGVSAEPTIDGLWPEVIRLPPRQRAAVVLRYYMDMTELQTAEVMGCRPGTVKSHLNKALTSLRKKVEEQ